MGSPVNVERFILEGQHAHSEEMGELALLLRRFGAAGKRIARELALAGLRPTRGSENSQKAYGDEQKKLDLIANEILLETFDDGGLVAIAASEEMEEPRVYEGNEGRYAVLFDPMDGSSNIDVNGSVGTVFSIRRRQAEGDEHLLRSGVEQVAAGYILFGPAVLLVYTSGEAVHVFTLDASIGEFLLTERTVRMPPRGRGYAANEGRSLGWPSGARKFVEYLKEMDPESGRPYSTRYSGSLVADFHRILHEGGIYLYPPDVSTGKTKGKLRILYECHPLALLAEIAGGGATTGRGRVLEVVPESLDDCTPFAIGSMQEVALYDRFYRETGA